MTPEEKLKLACRRVYGKEGSRTEDQRIVYNNLVFTAKQPTASAGTDFNTNQILMNVGIADWIWEYLKTYVDSKPQDDEQKPEIKT